MTPLLTKRLCKSLEEEIAKDQAGMECILQKYVDKYKHYEISWNKCLVRYGNCNVPFQAQYSSRKETIVEKEDTMVTCG